MGMGMSDMHNWNVSFHYSRGQGNYKNGFISNFHCKCQETSNLDFGDLKFRFKYFSEESNLSKSFNNNIEENDTFMNTFDQNQILTITRIINFIS